MEFTVTSPDGRTVVTVATGDRLTYAVARGGQPLILPSEIALRLADGRAIGDRATVSRSSARSQRAIIPRVVWQKASSVLEAYRELTLELENGSLRVRAYDDGVAYRFGIDAEGEVTVQSEQSGIELPGEPWIYFPREESFFSHNERQYHHAPLCQVTRDQMCSTPALIDTRRGAHLLVTESDLVDYPGLWLSGTGANALRGIFPAHVLEEEHRSDRDLVPVRRADYLARTGGPRLFPWRLLAIADRDADLLTNELVFLLSRPPQIDDVSWIRPGKAAWDWWNANNVYGVDFRAGINDATYRYYIDFAASHGLEYVILDEGWYRLGDLLSPVPELDLPALAEYGRRKHVGLILWVVWKTLQDQMTPALDLFARWGVRGIKIDFMQRDDQRMVNFYWTVAAEAARRRLLVAFHGSHKPAGINRAYPNVLTSEGVWGLEHAKTKTVTPGHCVTLPFTRMVAGPMDFTPGAMVNLPAESFRPMYTTPASLGTRCQQLAMYVIYESPLQMLCDSPTNYLREPECLEFLARVPTVWEQTLVLDARVATYLLLARRSGADWYLGAMTDERGRTLAADLSFLGPGSFGAEIWQDGLNADRHGNDYKKTTRRVTAETTLEVPMAPGGGWVALIRP
ncbi:MAG: glycoside hydrolase family 97 protein [Deltaproteobacteria bacterium]|nr:glycoside hydrolase family 97 protein [Deltaproteobacteria bacterium]